MESGYSLCSTTLSHLFCEPNPFLSNWAMFLISSYLSLNLYPNKLLDHCVVCHRTLVLKPFSGWWKIPRDSSFVAEQNRPHVRWIKCKSTRNLNCFKFWGSECPHTWGQAEYSTRWIKTTNFTENSYRNIISASCYKVTHDILAWIKKTNFKENSNRNIISASCYKVTHDILAWL